MGWWSGLAIGLQATFVLGGAVLELTASKWDGGVGLYWIAGNLCFGWGSFRINSFQVGWWSGLVLVCRQLLFWVGHCYIKHLAEGMVEWACYRVVGNSRFGWRSIRINSFQVGWWSGLVSGCKQFLFWVAQYYN
jgi:hypothetical protein